jgi:hypothetical protein
VPGANEVWEYAIAHPGAEFCYDFGEAPLSSPGEVISSLNKSPSGDDSLADLQEIVTFARSILADHRPAASAEMLELAERAATASEKRKDEDIVKWAERLARDVENAND